MIKVEQGNISIEGSVVTLIAEYGIIRKVMRKELPTPLDELDRELDELSRKFTNAKKEGRNPLAEAPAETFKELLDE